MVVTTCMLSAGYKPTSHEELVCGYTLDFV